MPLNGLFSEVKQQSKATKFNLTSNHNDSCCNIRKKKALIMEIYKEITVDSHPEANTFYTPSINSCITFYLNGNLTMHSSGNVLNMMT